MKRFLFWLAKVFKVDLTVEKVIYRDKIIEVPKEVIKEVIVEKQVALEGAIEGDVTVNGDLFVTGNIYVAGNITAFGGVVYGLSVEEVKMKAGKDVTAYKITEE